MKHNIPFICIFLIICALSSGCINKKPKIYKIGISSGVEYFNETIDGFKAGMQDLGY